MFTEPITLPRTGTGPARTREHPALQRNISRDVRRTLALVLAGGRGTRLKNLTTWRVKPAVPFGGKFRIIDFALSNCINSGLRRIAVLTQYKSHSLIRHITHGWAFLHTELGEFIDVMPAQQRITDDWYSGTADAVYQNLDILRRHAPEYVLILAGDHIYKMDYGLMLGFHRSHDADVTVGCIAVPRAEATRFGVMAVDENRRVTRFDEKPAEPAPIPGRPDRALASMGIYLFNADFLFEQLVHDADAPASTHDFGRDLLPALIETHRVLAYPFRNAGADAEKTVYWRDVGTVDSYWQANMELVQVEPELDLYDREWPIRSTPRQHPPAKFVFNDAGRRGMAVDSMVSMGCIVSGAYVEESLLFHNVRVEEQAVLKRAVVLPDVTVGPGARITRAVLDKRCRIPAGMVIGEDPDADRARFHVSDGGVVLVTPEMLGQPVHRVR